MPSAPCFPPPPIPSTPRECGSPARPTPWRPRRRPTCTALLLALAESLLLSGLGGTGGVVLGAGITAAYALSPSWGVAVPLPALAGGLGAALLIGAVSGLYPAMKAARLAPTEALRST